MGLIGLADGFLTRIKRFEGRELIVTGWLGETKRADVLYPSDYFL